MEVSKHLEGAYALLIKSTAYPGELVACKRGSPLILGIKVCAVPTQMLPVQRPPIMSCCGCHTVSALDLPPSCASTHCITFSSRET